MFCVPSQNYQLFFFFFWKYPEANCLRNSKMALKCQQAKHFMSFDQNMPNIVLVNNSRMVWHNKILVPFLSFSDNLLHEAYSFSKMCWQVLRYGITHAKFWLGAVPPYNHNPNCKLQERVDFIRRGINFLLVKYSALRESRMMLTIRTRS